MTTLALTGLKGHHPLGFLAACGLLRCCHEWDDSGSARLAWEESSHNQFTAVLHYPSKPDFTMLTQMLVRRGEQQRRRVAFSWSSKIDDREKYREAGLQLLRQPKSPDSCEDLSLLASLASDIVTTKKGVLRSTLFDLTSGNQQFLKSILALSGQAFTECSIREVLLGPWRYRDDEHSLGWDPLTQRLHALRQIVPEKDKTNRSVRAAVFLASQALPMFPCFAAGGKLETTCFHRDKSDDWFMWPIWSEPISLDTLKTLLAQPFDRYSPQRGVDAMYRCRRVKTGGAEGNYQVFSNAEQWSPDQKRKKRRTSR